MIKENNYSCKIVNKTDNELKNYIDNKSQFQEETVLAAIWELEKRNIVSDDIKSVETQIENKRIIENKNKGKEKKDINITDDPNAPILYHSKFMRVFGILFSVFAGGILMALNFSRLGNKKIAWIVVLSGLLYSILQVILLNQIGINTTGLTILISILGMYLLDAIFWKKHVPTDLKFKKRNIWSALIIGLISWIPFIYAIVATK